VSILQTLKKIFNIIFSPNSNESPYTIYKTVAELAKLTNEITGYVAELEFEFDEMAIATHFDPEVFERIYNRPFSYTQMDPENRFITPIVQQRRQFLAQFNHCRSLFKEQKLEEYKQAREPAILEGRRLLENIQLTVNKLPF